MLKQVIILAISVVSILLLSACGSSVVESKAALSKKSDTNFTNEESADDNSSDENKPIDEDSAPETAIEDTSDTQAELNKDAYLKKLNEMEKADRFAESKSTTVELIEQETERYEKWDKELNDIYGLLKEQLSPEQMDSLRNEQRKWITERDKKAREESFKYKGGSMEPLEYVATQATFTRERCYELVAKYMNE